jgi:hypothetical protein
VYKASSRVSSDEASIGFCPKIAAVFEAIAETVLANPSLNFLKRLNMRKGGISNLELRNSGTEH